MRSTKIRIYKGTAAACVAAVAMSGAFAPVALAQPAPEAPPAAVAPPAPDVPPAPGPAAPPPALGQLPPAPTPEQIQTSILQLIEIGRVAVAVGAEGLRIAFEALNAAEQAVVAADNNYLIAESEHGAGSPEAVAAGAQKDLTESKVETAGLKGDAEAASVATPESEKRREAASVAPALKDEAPKEEEEAKKADEPAPTTEMGKAVKDVREKQEAYTKAAQAERDLLKRTDANPATVQELREAAEKTRIAEEELVASIGKLEQLTAPEGAPEADKAPAAAPPAATEAAADKSKDETPKADVPEKPKTDTPAKSPGTSAPATSTTTAAATVTVTASAPSGGTQSAPKTEPTTPAPPKDDAAAGLHDAPPASGGGGAMAPKEDAPAEAPAETPKAEEQQEEATPPLPEEDAKPEEDSKPKGNPEEREFARRALALYGEIGVKGDLKDLAPFWEKLADDKELAAAVGAAIGTPLGEPVRQYHTGLTTSGDSTMILTTPGTKGCVKAEPGRVNNVGYGNYNCIPIFEGTPEEVKGRAAEWAALKDKPNSDPKKKEFLKKYVEVRNSDQEPASDTNKRRIAALDELAAIYTFAESGK